MSTGDDLRAPRLSIASLNLHYGTDPQENPYDVVGALLGLDADVVALQEVWRPDRPDGRPDMLSAMREHGYTVEWLPLARARVRPTLDIRCEAGRSEGWWGVAVASRLPVLRSERIWIGRTPLDPVDGRWALNALVGVGSGESVSVTAMHSTHYVPFAVLNAARLSRALGRPGRSLVVGDLNLWGPAASMVFRGWQRPVRGRTFPTPRPHSQIDHLFASPDLEVTAAEVAGAVGSDHLPIRACVSLASS